jgi:hypothetical protein
MSNRQRRRDEHSRTLTRTLTGFDQLKAVDPPGPAKLELRLYYDARLSPTGWQCRICTVRPDADGVRKPKTVYRATAPTFKNAVMTLLDALEALDLPE